jgi:oxygen-dependent protoporphyrinogen oxidase
VTKVAIIGAGITGLSSLYYLVRDNNDTSVDLYEATERAGGKVKTHQRDGYTIELGPESYLSRKKVMTELAEEIGMGADLVRNETGQSYIYANHRLNTVPAGTMLGVPTEIEPFMKTDLVSWAGKLTAGLDLLRKPDRLYKDVSVGRFFRQRLGDEVLEKMIEPLLSGVYGTDIDKLSLMSTYPYFKEREQKYGGLIKGMIKEKAPKENKKKIGQFFQFKNGLQSFIDQLKEKGESLGGRVHLNSDVSAIEKQGDAYTLTVNGEDKEYDKVIITTPHFQYKRWFDDKELEYFNHMTATSVATVVMAFDDSQVKNDIDGTGFVVSRTMDTAITACTWTNKKWLHSSPEGKTLLRAYVGRPGDFIVQEKNDDEIVRLARKDLDKIMTINGDAEFTIVTRLERSMPNYHVGHKEIIDYIHRYMSEQYPGVYLIGASHYGVGLPDCVQTAKDTAFKILSK